MPRINKFFPFLLILSLVAGAMELDLSIPCFPEIAEHFQVTEEVVDRTVSLNFLGFFFTALFYGPLSDRFGRRWVLIGGGILFFLGSLGCALAPSMMLILLSRFLQGMGASASYVIAFTMISDVYEGKEMTKWQGISNGILSITVATAPLIGGALNTLWGWRSAYHAVALLSFISLVLLLIFLPESRKGRLINIRSVLADYNALLRSTTFMRASFIPMLIFGGYFAFVSIAPFIYRDLLGASILSFSVQQSLLIFAFASVSTLAAPITALWGEKRPSLQGFLWSGIFTAALALFSLLFDLVPWHLTLVMLFYNGATAVGYSYFAGIALKAIPEKNASASSLYVSIRSLITALMVQTVGWFSSGTLFYPVMLVAATCFAGYFLAASHFKKEDGQAPIAEEIEPD